MNCQECQQQLEAMISGRSEAGVRALVESHVRECSHCAKTFDEERKLWEMLGSATSPSPSHGFADRALRQLDVEPEPARGWWGALPSWMRWSAATVVVLIAIGVATLLIFHTVPQQRRSEIAKEESGANPVQHFEELFTIVQNIDLDSVVNGPLDQNENGETL